MIRADIDQLPQYGASTLPASIRLRLIEKINGLTMHVLEAGEPGRPCVLLLHGFPTSSHMFRDLISALADKFQPPL